MVSEIVCIFVCGHLSLWKDVASDSTMVNLISSHGQFSRDLTTPLFGYWTMLVHSQNVLKSSGALEILAIKALS